MGWRSGFTVAAAAAAIVGFGPAALAAGYPDKPIRVVVPTAPGGSSDLCMRAVTPLMNQQLGQSIVVENVTGATGSIGLERVANSAADGYSLAVPAGSNLTNALTRPKRAFDLLGRLQPIGKTCVTPLTLVVSPALGVDSVAQLVAYGRKNPGALSYSSNGMGSSQHLMMEIFIAATGLQMTHAPFRGESLAAPEIKAGRVSMAFLAGAKPFIDGGLVVPLATTNPGPWQPLPDLPALNSTLPELAGVSFVGWSGLMAPMGSPPDVVRKLSAALQFALRDEQVRKLVIGMGNMPGAGTPEDFAEGLRSDAALFGNVIRQRNLTFDD